MNYHEFFYDSLSIILEGFEQYIPTDYLIMLKKKYEQTINPKNSIYIQIFAYSSLNTRTKIQQWKFKPKGQALLAINLQRSYSQKNSNDNDSELSFSQLNEPSFFKTLENIRKSIQPKLLLKKLTNLKILCQIKDNQNQLLPFQSGKTFYFQVSQYQNQFFQIKLSFKYNYLQDQVVAQEIQQLHQLKVIKSSDSGDFQLLIDQSYERQRQKEIQFHQKEIQFNQKEILFNQKNVHKRQSSIQKNIIITSVTDKQEKLTQRKWSQKVVLPLQRNISQSQSGKLLKSKRQQDFLQIEKMLKNIDFSQVESTRLKSFIEYLV